MANNTFNPTALANGTSNLLVRASALNMSTDLVQAGVVFNDAVRASLGLFSLAGSKVSQPVESTDKTAFIGGCFWGTVLSFSAVTTSVV